MYIKSCHLQIVTVLFLPFQCGCFLFFLAQVQKLNAEHSLSPWTNSFLFMKPHVGNVGIRDHSKVPLLCNKPPQNLRGFSSHHFLSWFLWVRNFGEALPGNSDSGHLMRLQLGSGWGWNRAGRESLFACSFRVSPRRLVWLPHSVVASGR